jgi:hypothetical protein
VVPVVSLMVPALIGPEKVVVAMISLLSWQMSVVTVRKTLSS